MSKYTADFETTVEEDQTRVWAWGTCEIGNVDRFEHGTTIDEFFEWCRKGENKTVYFHNLKFDGAFIIDWLLKNGFTHSDYKGTWTFNTIISDMGQFYSIEVIFMRLNKRFNKVTFYDSLKKLPFPVAKIAKDFGLPIQKLDIDYTMERPIGYQLTEHEIEYLKNDVQIVAIALGLQFDEGLNKMTTGSDALNNFKQTYGKAKFKVAFPVVPIEIDSEIRTAYRGGFTYLNKKYIGKDVGEGIVFDVNSLYPYIMYDRPLPYGFPIYFTGKYEVDEFYPLYIQEIVCEFKLKKDKIPTIQLKNNLSFVPTEYIEESGIEPVSLVLTNVDLKLFFEHYDVYVHEYVCGWKFKSHVGFFKEYIDKWSKVKEENTGARRLWAKLMLNSLYGKFATNPKLEGMYPYLNDKEIVSYSMKETEYRDPVYTPIAVFITSWARDLTIRTAQSVYPRFIYADTDSIHLEGTEPPEIEVHPTRLGAWKHEGTFQRARFIRAKTYIEDFGDHLQVTCAGMPDSVKKKVTWENFRRGFKENGKLLPRRVRGGVVLRDTEFTLK